jgi:hypothetical protein
MQVCRRSLSVLIPLIVLCLIGSTRIAEATANGSLRIQVDVPSRTATVEIPFLIAGWALDTASLVDSNIDTVHAWAFPLTGDPIFLGAATMNVPRPDVAAAFGARFQNAGFSLIVTQALKPGAYTLQVFARRASTGTFDVVEQVPVTVRGITLSDLRPCAAGQGPQFDGTKWICATNRGATGPGPAGEKGEPGSPASEANLGRIAYSARSVTVRCDIPGDKEIGVLTITPSGNAGEVAFVKVDAAIHLDAGSSAATGSDIIVRLVREGSSDGSVAQRFFLAHGGAPSALTWAVEAPAGVPSTFRVLLSHASAVGSFTADTAISAIAAPLGANGTKSLN